MDGRYKLRATVYTPVDLLDPGGRIETQGLSRNLSASGILVSLPAQLPVGGRWTLSFSYPGVRVPIQCRAECLRCGEEYALGRPGGSFLAAFSFLDLSPGLTAQLDQAVLGTARSIAGFLGDFEVFAGLSGELLLGLAGAFRSLPLREGESWPGEWDLSSSLILIRSGLVKLFRPGFLQGRELAFLGSLGHVLGEQALLAGEPHNLRLRALCPSEVLVLGTAAHDYLRREEPEICAVLEAALLEIVGQREARGVARLMPLGLSAVGVGH